MGEETIVQYTVGEFRGNFPDVPAAPGVDLDELRTLDPDPLFVTLPIIPEIGQVSGNGLLYDDALAASIEEQINDKRPGGRFGHLSKEQADTAYPIPEGMWLGAKREGATLWAKAYIPPGAARDHIKRLRAVKGSIATSIWGKGDYEQVRAGVRRLTNFALESLDFAPPERAALGYRATPIITAEMQEETEMNKEQLIAELAVGDIPAALRQQIIAAAGDNGQAGQVAELRQQLTDSQTIISELQTQVAKFQRQQFDQAVNDRIAALTNWPVTEQKDIDKLAALRRTIRARVLETLGNDRADDKVAGAIDAVWADVQPIAETLRDALAGPAAVVSGKVRSKRPTVEDTPEARAKARAEFAF